MINSKEPLTGVIETDNKAYSFYLNNYSMVFLDAVVNSNLTSTMKPLDCFAQAYTHKGHKMLIHIGKHDFPVVNTMKMKLSNYLVSTSNIFDYISLLSLLLRFDQDWRPQGEYSSMVS